MGAPARESRHFQAEPARGAGRRERSGEDHAGQAPHLASTSRAEGRIVLCDGKDLRDWDAEQLRHRFGVLFQDFNQYQLNVRENVGFGSVGHLEDVPRIERAVDRGGSNEVVATLPLGLEAPLGRWFKDGSELSGGQWQKVALSRAFMREEADILVLDEPTAALDANAEHAVFARFRELAEGRTTIVISHRFPTVRMASQIIVFSHGEIVETGSHDELVAKGGRYARMFALQAEGYRPDREPSLSAAMRRARRSGVRAHSAQGSIARVYCAAKRFLRCTCLSDARGRRAPRAAGDNRPAIPAAAMASTRPSPEAGPVAIAIATARLSSMTGEGAMRASSA